MQNRYAESESEQKKTNRSSKTSARTRTIPIHQWHFIKAYRHRALCIIYIYIYFVYRPKISPECVREMYFRSLHLIAARVRNFPAQHLFVHNLYMCCVFGWFVKHDKKLARLLGICIRMHVSPNWPLSPGRHLLPITMLVHRKLHTLTYTHTNAAHADRFMQIQNFIS